MKKAGHKSAQTTIPTQQNSSTATSSSPTNSRRQLLKGVLAAGSAGLLAACGSDSDNGASGSGGRKSRTLKMVTAWPKNFPGLGTGAERIAKRIEALSAGRIKVRVYAAGELVSGLDSFDAVSQGKADMYHAAEYYWQGKSPAFNFFAAVPMGLTASEMSAWIHFGGGQELWDELASGFNIKPFMAGNSGSQMGGWFKKDITSVNDFQGLRIRMPGLGGEVMKRLGATPVTKSGGEIFQALSQGNIDATEWVGPWNDLAFGFHTIVKNYFYPGIHEAGTTLSLGLNQDLWNELDELDQAIIKTAATMENDVMHAEFNAGNAVALDTLVEEHGVNLKRFPDDVLKRIVEISEEVLAEVGKHDDISSRVYQSFKKARNGGIRWGAVGERAFEQARDLIG